MTDVTDEAQRLREELDAERGAGARPSASPAENAGCSTSRQDELELLEMVAASSNEGDRDRARPGRGDRARVRPTCAGPSGTPTSPDQATGTLRASGVWYLEDEARFAAFRAASEGPRPRPVAADERHGHGRVGVGDRHGREPRALSTAPGVARTAGLRAGFAFPILVGSRPSGVLEFFTGGPAVADPALLHIMDQIGVQLGRVVERERGARRARALQRRPRGLRLRRLARPGRATALGRGASSRCSSASTAIGLDDRAREFIAYAVDGVERMQRMIDDLLLYARAGTADLRLERVDAGELVAGALRDLGTAVAERGPVVEVGELPVLRADPGQLQRVFLNLLGNAIKYTAPGRRAARDGPRAQRRRRRRDRGGRQRDRHRPAQVERAFEMFARLPAVRATTRARDRDWPSRAGSWSAMAGACGSSPTPAAAACSPLRLPLR
jgi:signal transduction histidine kinase